MRIRTGDEVLVIAGKFRGERGVVEEALPSRDMVVLEGLNVAKRHTKAQGTTMQAGIIDKDMPISASSVQIICSTDGPTRVGYKFNAEGVKVRVCKKCGGEL